MMPAPEEVWSEYGRTSAEEQRERQTILHQVDAFVKFRVAQAYQPAETYLDDGVSGDVPMLKRPQGSRMLDDARLGCFSVLVIYSISRLARTTRECLNVAIKLKEEYGIAIKSISEPFDTSTPFGWYVFTQFAAMYELEKAIILDRTQKGLDKKARDGKWPGGKVPYGLRTVDGFLVANEEEADVVRLVFHLCADQGWGTWRIADYLNAREVLSPMHGKRTKRQHSGLWTSSAVLHLLHREWSATGVYYYGKTKGIRREGVTIDREARPQSECFPLEVPVLVPPEKFEAVQARLAESFAKATRNRRRVYPLRGKVLCLKCQEARGTARPFTGHLVRASRQGRARDFIYYSCASCWDRTPETRCRAPRISASEIEACVWEQVKHLLTHAGEYLNEVLEEIGARRARAGEAPDLAEDPAAVTARLAAAHAERKRIQEMVKTGFATQEEMTGDMRAVRAEIARLEALQRAALRRTASGRADHDQAADMARQILGRLRDSILRAEEDEHLREELIRLLLVRVEASPTGLEAIYTFMPQITGKSGGAALGEAAEAPVPDPSPCLDPGNVCSCSSNTWAWREQLQIRRPLVLKKAA